MADVFIRVELFGKPGIDVYTRPHTLMEKTRGWFATVVGNSGHTMNLAHAMCKGATRQVLP
jgi:hypothetical protein